MAKHSTDKVVILKIRKYLSYLGQVYAVIKDLDTETLQDELLAYAAAQLITNLKECFDMIQSDDIQERYKLLRKPSIVRIRNISAHDYEALNWEIVKSGCGELIRFFGQKDYHDETLRLIEKEDESEIKRELRESLEFQKSKTKE